MINNRRPRCHKHPGRRFCFADIWKTAACPAFEKISLQVRNIARIGTSHSLILIGKARVNADPIVSAIVLANEFSELLEAKATVKRH